MVGAEKWSVTALDDGQGFAVLITVDQNLRHQQNLSAAGVALIVLIATSSRLADLLPLIPSVQRILGTLQAGDVVEVTA